VTVSSTSAEWCIEPVTQIIGVIQNYKLNNTIAERRGWELTLEEYSWKRDQGRKNTGLLKAQTGHLTNLRDLGKCARKWNQE
jgi:hypothetical protein